MEYMFLTGLFSMSRFVLMFLKKKQHHNNNTLQKENNWDANQSQAFGSEHRLPCILFPPVV
jgi:hypothetical protein